MVATDVMPAPRVYVNGTEADPSTVVMPLEISHGRSSAESQPDAPQLTIIWRNVATAPVAGDELKVIMRLPAGDPVTWDDPTVQYDDARVTYGGGWLSEVPRFAGFVSDSDVQEVAGQPTNVRVVAIGYQAMLGRAHLVMSRPAETDVQRVAAISSWLGWYYPIEVHGNASANLKAVEYDKDALSALHEICNASGGLLWQDGKGQVHYGSGDHRALREPKAAFGAHVIISGLQWQQSLGDLINSVEVKYGDTNATTTMTDDASIAAFGPYQKSTSTILVDQTAAGQLAALILARRAWPFWRMSDVMFDSDHTNDALDMWLYACTLEVSDSVLLPILPDPAPTGQLAEWIVEGWKEEWPTPHRVILQVAVTDRARFAFTMLRLWQDAALVTWDAERQGSWLDALIKEVA